MKYWLYGAAAALAASGIILADDIGSLILGALVGGTAGAGAAVSARKDKSRQ